MVSEGLFVGSNQMNVNLKRWNNSKEAEDVTYDS